MHGNAITIESFYSAFQSGDAETMAAVYGPDATFSDPVFDLVGRQIGDMWRMFCRSGGDLQVDFASVSANDDTGSANWEARYTFKPTGRAVHNVIAAEFAFDNGVVISHRDSFSMWKWSGQALGLPGQLLGWTPMLRNKVRAQAASQLSKFQAGNI